jgi:hypothetical protein
MIVLYARVSTVEQTTKNQLTQAARAGFKIDMVVADDGVSGVNTRLAERPEGRRLYDTLVVRWVDRLGRDYADVCDTIREFMRRGVVIKTVISRMTFDGNTDPMQQAVRDALIAFMAVQRRPKPPKQHSGPASTISAAWRRMPTWAASRAMTALHSTGSWSALSNASADRADRPPPQGRPTGIKCNPRRIICESTHRLAEPLNSFWPLCGPLAAGNPWGPFGSSTEPTVGVHLRVWWAAAAAASSSRAWPASIKELPFVVARSGAGSGSQ